MRIFINFVKPNTRKKVYRYPVKPYQPHHGGFATLVHPKAVTIILNHQLGMIPIPMQIQQPSLRTQQLTIQESPKTIRPEPSTGKINF
jgi:hypothetical protein